MVLKLTPELLTALGAKDESEASAKLVETISLISTLKTTVSGLEAKLAACATSASVSDLLATVNAVKTSVDALPNAEKVKQIASDAGSMAASNAVGRVNGSTVPPPAPSAEQPSAADPVETLLTEGKFEEAWNKSAKLKEEFSTAASFAAFKRAEAKGQIRIFKPNTK